MFNVRLSSLHVLDHDEALDFYCCKLGFEVHTDADLGFMRWLTICAPGDRSREVLLEVPGPPVSDEATAATARDLLTKGAAAGWIGLEVDDVRAVYDDLRAKGVEFTQEPVERDYGIDVGLRDPFGNAVRILQHTVAPARS